MAVPRSLTASALGAALVVAVVMAMAAAPVHARDAVPVAVVIDDVGNLRHEGLRAVELPGPITYAMLPHTPHAASLARIAHALGKEVLVHLPMEADPPRPLGPGGLTAALARHQFERRVRSALDSVPHARGASNHMGSLLTTLPVHMDWLMQVLSSRRGWVFLDSRTTARTVAEDRALAAGVGATWRDVFLDNDPSPDAIRRQLRTLASVAHRHGSAVAIGHPYPQTLEVLAQSLPRMRGDGLRLAPLSEVIAMRARQSVRVAQESSPGQAASTRHTPSAPSTQLSSGAPATIIGWNPSRP